jgi:hypothetical protein
MARLENCEDAYENPVMPDDSTLFVKKVEVVRIG